MSRRKVSADAEPARFVLRLYLAGDAPNSMRARANLDAILREHPPKHHSLEIVDVLKDPKRALGDGILVTPTLVKVSPAPELHFVGNLSDRENVLHALGWSVS